MLARMAIHDARFERKLNRLRSGDISAHFSGMALSQDQLQQLCDAVRNSADLQFFTLDQSALGDEAAIMLADALRGKASIVELLLSNAAFGDAGICALAETFATLPNLDTLALSGNPFTNKGAAALACYLQASAPNLTQLYVSDAPFGEAGKKDLEAAIMGRQKRNIIWLRGLGVEADEFGAANRRCAQQYLNPLTLTLLKDLPKHRYFDLAEQQAVIHQTIFQGGIPNGNADDALIKANKQIATFNTFLDSIPLLDIERPFSLEDLFVEHKWEGSTFPVSAVENPRFWQQFERVVERLNEQGVQLRTEELLDETGKNPNEFLQRVIDRGCVGALFKKANWAGATQAEVRRMLHALPEAARNSISNTHTLVASLGKSLSQKSISK